MNHHRLLIDGKSESGASTFEVRNPWNSEVCAKVELASSAQLEKAMAVSHTAFQSFRKSSRFLRTQLLQLIVKGITERKEEFVTHIVREAGKPRKLAVGEVDRAITTFTLAAEETKRFGGEVVPLDFEESAQAFGTAVSHWVPRGPVLAISPFNFPLNLVAHKVAPALAVGTTVLLKPPPQAPGAAHLLGDVIQSAITAMAQKKQMLPVGIFQVVHATNEVMAAAVKDSRLSILSFTGSDRAGFHLQALAVRKKALLELGGNAALIVCKDSDLGRAAARAAFGAYAYAGQVCISVQRIFVEKSVAEAFKNILLAEIKKIKTGDPTDPDTLVGPMIDLANAERVQSWIQESVKAGAKILCGGDGKGSLLNPTLLESVPHTAKLSCEEVFGPVAIIEAFESVDEVIAKVNESRFGLQAGVFTHDERIIQKMIDDLEVGGVIINEVPTYRSDQMPYGGAKDSGLGREGVRYTMTEYCEPKVAVRFRS